MLFEIGERSSPFSTFCVKCFFCNSQNATAIQSDRREKHAIAIRVIAGVDQMSLDAHVTNVPADIGIWRQA